jgi:hypothetical protein
MNINKRVYMQAFIAGFLKNAGYTDTDTKNLAAKKKVAIRNGILPIDGTDWQWAVTQVDDGTDTKHWDVFDRSYRDEIRTLSANEEGYISSPKEFLAKKRRGEDRPRRVIRGLPTAVHLEKPVRAIYNYISDTKQFMKDLGEESTIHTHPLRKRDFDELILDYKNKAPEWRRKGLISKKTERDLVDQFDRRYDKPHGVSYPSTPDLDIFKRTNVGNTHMVVSPYSKYYSVVNVVKDPKTNRRVAKTIIMKDSSIPRLNRGVMDKLVADVKNPIRYVDLLFNPVETTYP